MARIHPISQQIASDTIKSAFEKHAKAYDSNISNMQATLGHSQLALDIYMQWYPLYEKVKTIIGERPASLFAWSASNASNCALYAAVFRKIMADAGDDPEKGNLNEYEKILVNFGSAIALHKGCIANHVYNNLAIYHTDQEMVVLIAFVGQIIAANIFNNVVETDIDKSLIDYKPARYFL